KKPPLPPEPPKPPPEPVKPPEPIIAKPVPPPEPPKPVEKPKPKKLTVQDMIDQANKLRDKGQTEKALDTYGRALDEAPDNVEALAGRGWCYVDMAEYAPAEASFQAALDKSDKYEDA